MPKLNKPKIRALIASLILLSMPSCALATREIETKAPPASNVCLDDGIITVGPHDVLVPETAREILAHNNAYVKRCPAAAGIDAGPKAVI